MIREEQPVNAALPTLQSLGIFTLISFSHSLKAPLPIDVTLVGMVTEVSFVPRNASLPIDVTLLEMVTEAVSYTHLTLPTICSV